jgi:hypothetical protein
MKEHSDMWTRADAMIEQGQKLETRIFGMQVGLDSATQAAAAERNMYVAAL